MHAWCPLRLEEALDPLVLELQSTCELLLSVRSPGPLGEQLVVYSTGKAACFTSDTGEQQLFIVKVVLIKCSLCGGEKKQFCFSVSKEIRFGKFISSSAFLIKKTKETARNISWLQFP